MREGSVQAHHLLRDSEVLGHLPWPCEPQVHRLASVDQQRSRELLCFPLNSTAQLHVPSQPEVVARVQEPVPDCVRRDPAPPRRVETLRHRDDAVHLHLLQHLERPRMHLQPKQGSHRFGVHLAPQPELAPQPLAPGLRKA